MYIFIECVYLSRGLVLIQSYEHVIDYNFLKFRNEKTFLKT